MPANPSATPSSLALDGASPGGFRHELLLYAEGDRGFVRGTAPPVREALAHDAQVLVAVAAARAAALSEALGPDAERVRFVDVLELARNPARMMPVWEQFACEHALAGGGRALAIGEPVWPGRSQAELIECERHEALVNVAFAAGPAWRLLCPYDADALDERVIEAALASHPLVRSGERAGANDACTCGGRPPRPFEGTLPAPRGTVSELAFAAGGLAQVRRHTGAWAAGEGLEGDGVDDLVLAVDELAANSIRHGGGAGTLRCWREADALVCEVRDAGTIAEPLAGRRRPPADSGSGRGLWLVNQLCDLVQVRSAPGRTAVRVRKRL